MKKISCLRRQPIFILIIVLITAVIFACFLPTAEAYAADAPNTPDSIHFINPTAITVMGDRLYVADNIEDGKTALLYFDIGGNIPSLTRTYEWDGVITGLFSDNDTELYAAMGATVAVLNVTEDKEPSVKVSYVFDKTVKGFVKGIFNQAETYYALTDRLLRVRGENNYLPTTQGILTNTKGCVALNGVVYYAHQDGTDYVCGGYDTNNAAFLEQTLSFNNEPKGLITYKNNVAFFTDHSIKYVNDITMGYWTNNQPLQGNALETLIDDTSNKTIADVALHGETLFILNDGINKIDMYTKGENGYGVTYTIGSDIVNYTVPTAFTDYTLARSNGYPTNIVYKTNAKNSIEEIITNATEYIILGYDNDVNSHYYYVMTGDKFGWVKKSADNATPETDPKITVIDNRVGEEGYSYETKFTSLNSVYIYDLPISSASQTQFTQTAENMKPVKVLQEFKEGEQIWYYISFDEGKTGFVKKESVGKFHIVRDETDTELETEGLRKINSSLFNAVSLYATPDLEEGETVADADGNVLKLYSGDKVDLISAENGVAFVMVQHTNGKCDFGYIEANRLIGVHDMTTNSIVGISLLAFAIVLAVILITVYFKRKKKIRANKN